VIGGGPAFVARIHPFVATALGVESISRTSSSTMRRTFSRSTFALLTASALAMSGAVLSQEQEQAPQQQAEPDPPQLLQREDGGLAAGQIPAVLKTRDANFVYRSSTRLLSCDQLRQRIANIMRAVGARQDVDVRADDCESFIDPTLMSDPGRMGRGSQNPMDPFDRSSSSPLDRGRSSRSDLSDRNRSQSTPVRIRLMMPVEVTAGIVEEVERDKARRELVSRVQGNRNAAMNDAIFFPAERREVELSHDTIDLDPIDCELLEQLSMAVFRKLDLKVTNRSLSCDPRERSHIRPSLTVQALLPVGFQMPVKQKKKVEGSISIP